MNRCIGPPSSRRFFPNFLRVGPLSFVRTVEYVQETRTEGEFMGIRKRLAFVAATSAAAVTLALLPPLLTTASAAAPGAPFHQIAHRIGSAHLSRSVSSGSTETRPAAGDDVAKTGKAVANRSPSSHKPVPPPPSSGVTGDSLSVQSGPGAVFAGINHRQQRLADGGNQWSLTPPDQGLCAGAGQVVETVNNAVRP
jgi:hypothetical protein